MASIEKYATKTGQRYKVRYRDADNRQHQRKGFSTLKEARLYAATVETKVASGTWVDPSAGKVTVGSLYPSWRDGQTHIKATTKATRLTAWNAHVKERWEAVEVGKIRPSAVRSWVAAMATSGAGAATIENALGVLRGVLSAAVEDGLIPANPAAGVRAPRRTPKAKRYLTHQQVAALAAECGDDAVIVDTLVYTCIRAGELAGLRVADVDFLRRRLNISRSISYVRGAGMVESATKTYESRSIPLVASLAEPLSRRAAGKARDDLLFGGAEGETWRVNNWRRRVFHPAVARCRKADDTFPALTVHDLRAAGISLLIAAGANLKLVQLYAGHASGSVTADVYGSLLPDTLDTVSEALERQRLASCDPGVTPQADRPTSETPSFGSVAGQRGSR